MRNRVPKSIWSGRRKSGGRREAKNGAGESPKAPAASRRGESGGGDPQKHFARYVELAKAAASSGDVVESEKYYQYADHFRRVMNAKST